MTQITREHLLSRRGILPPMVYKKVRIFRLDAKDQIAAEQVVEEAEGRSPTKRERPTANSPDTAASRTWHLWSDMLGGYVPQRCDYIEYQGEVWYVESVRPEMSSTRYRCETTQSSDPTKVAS